MDSKYHVTPWVAGSHVYPNVQLELSATGKRSPSSVFVFIGYASSMHTEIDLEAIGPPSHQFQPTPDEPNQVPKSSTTDTKHGDSSWPLYAMYSKIVQEEDNKIAELHQKSADGILIFVSPRVTPSFSVPQLEKHRAVYTRSLSPYSLPSHSQTSSPTLK
jgi:hypothetical protein